MPISLRTTAAYNDKDLGVWQTQWCVDCPRWEESDGNPIWDQSCWTQYSRSNHVKAPPPLKSGVFSAWLLRLHDTYMDTLMSPSPLGTTTKGEIHPDGPSGNSSVMLGSRSWLSVLSTFSHDPKGILRSGWATGLTDSLIWSLSLCPFKRWTPVNKASHFSRIQLLSPPLSTLFTWKGPMGKRLRICAVSWPSSIQPLPLTTTTICSKNSESR